MMLHSIFNLLKIALSFAVFTLYSMENFSRSTIKKEKPACGIVIYTASNDKFILTISRNEEGYFEGSCTNSDEHTPSFYIPREKFPHYFERLKKLYNDRAK